MSAEPSKRDVAHERGHEEYVLSGHARESRVRNILLATALLPAGAAGILAARPLGKFLDVSDLWFIFGWIAVLIGAVLRLGRWAERPIQVRVTKDGLVLMYRSPVVIPRHELALKVGVVAREGGPTTYAVFVGRKRGRSMASLPATTEEEARETLERITGMLAVLATGSTYRRGVAPGEMG